MINRKRCALFILCGGLILTLSVSSFGEFNRFSRRRLRFQGGFPGGQPAWSFPPVSSGPTLFQTGSPNIATDGTNTFVLTPQGWSSYVFDTDGKVWVPNPAQPGTNVQLTDENAISALRRYWTQWPIPADSQNWQVLKPFLNVRPVPAASGQSPDGLMQDDKWLYYKGSDQQIRVVRINQETGDPYFSDGFPVPDTLIERLQGIYREAGDRLKDHPLVASFKQKHPWQEAAPLPDAPATPDESATPPNPPANPPPASPPPVEPPPANPPPENPPPVEPPPANPPPESPPPVEPPPVNPPPQPVDLADPAGAGTKCALIMAGPGNGEPKDGDFGRATAAQAWGLKARGYDVTVLIGFSQESATGKVLRDKVDKVPGGKLTVDALNETTIDHFFANHPNCKKMLVRTHGHGNQCGKPDGVCSAGTCSSVRGDEKNDLNSTRSHHFAIAEQGAYDRLYNSQSLVDHIQTAEEKAHVEFVLDSCHSGRVKRFLQKLKNTCTVVLSTGNSSGFGCGDHDPDGITDYTSTIEMVDARDYANVLPDLANEPYFIEPKEGDNKKVCFGKIKNHLEKEVCKGRDLQTCLATMQDAFWAGRHADWTPQEPFISSTLPSESTEPAVRDYFTQENYNHALVEAEYSVAHPRATDNMEEASGDDIANALDKLLALASDPELNQAKEQLIQKIVAYNETLKEAKKLHGDYLKAKPEDKPALLNQLSDTQVTLRKASMEAIKLERALVEKVRAKNPQAFGASPAAGPKNACEQTL